MNKRKIRITIIKDHGKSHEIYCDRILMLRKARRAGDVETVNNFVYSKLVQNRGEGFDFEVIA